MTDCHLPGSNSTLRDHSFRHSRLQNPLCTSLCSCSELFSCPCSMREDVQTLVYSVQDAISMLLCEHCVAVVYVSKSAVGAGEMVIRNLAVFVNPNNNFKSVLAHGCVGNNKRHREFYAKVTQRREESEVHVLVDRFASGGCSHSSCGKWKPALDNRHGQAHFFLGVCWNIWQYKTCPLKIICTGNASQYSLFWMAYTCICM
jgi:hypothetical protein